MSPYRAIGLILVLLTPCLSQQVVVRFNNNSQVIRDVLRDAHASGSLVFSGGCKFQDRTAPVPTIGMRRDEGSVRETLQKMLAVNSKIRVTQDADGMIRMVEADVPTDILDVKIHHVSFPAPTRISSEENQPLYLRGGFVALTTILATPEAAAFTKARHVDFDARMGRLEGNILSESSWPHVTGELSDVTLSQALDYVLKTFPGYWVYEDASCEDGSRKIRFAFH